MSLDARGILLIDHGSRLKASHEQLLEIAEMLRKSLRGAEGQPIVAIAHLEVTPPTIQEGFLECVRLGATRILVIPCFLSRGRHVTADIPEQLESVARQCPSVSFEVADPLSELPGFIDLLRSAIRQFD